MKYRYWTTEEEDTLKRMAHEGASVFAIAKAIDRTPMAVILHARIISGLESPDAMRRMPEEYYEQTKTISQVAVEHGRRWTKEDNELLKKKFYDGSNIFQIAKYFNRTPNAIIYQIQKLNAKPEQMNALFDRAKLLLGKKRVVRRPNVEDGNDVD